MNYKIEIDKFSLNKIFLHKDIIQQLLPSEINYITLKIGSFQKKVKLEKNLNKNIVISEDIYRKINIPLEIPYELIIKNNEINIGPVIGILTSGIKDEITERKLRIYKNYLINYEQINGIVLLFTLDGINEYDKLATGFYYSPYSKNWKETTCVFPSVIFSRIDIDTELHEGLYRIVRNNLFNAYNFNKLEMWQWLSSSQELHKHIPETVLIDTPEKVFNMLNKYNKVYLKPIKGKQGVGIMHVEKEIGTFILNYRYKGDNFTITETSWEDIWQEINRKMKKRPYLVQQHIPLIKINDQIIDIRVIVQKGKHGIWEVQGMITRYGAKKSIISNISSGGTAEKTWQTLLKIENNDVKKAYKKWKEIEMFSLKICEKLDKTGYNYGNLGVDIAIDTNGELWLIEINNSDPDPTIALDAGDRELYFRTKAQILYYAKWLTGFIFS